MAQAPTATWSRATGSGPRLPVNLACPNVNGIDIVDAGTSGNLVAGNLIGTNLDGTTAVGNTGAGVFVAAGATGNTIGGSSSAARNLISGDAVVGIALFGAGTDSNVVAGNWIGTSISGDTAIPNGTTARFYAAYNAIIGGGVVIEGGASGNRIGTDGASGDFGDANLISGNDNDGIDILGDGTSGNVVAGNLIGTNATGTAAVGNTGDGVFIVLGAAGNTIGGTSAAAANVISGNGNDGIDIEASCLIEGNLIGTNASGTGAVGNSIDGIFVNSPGVTIGGTAAGAANVISGAGEGEKGIDTEASCLVEGNLIGTNLSGDGLVFAMSDGIFVGSPGATIGGTSSAAANVISGNVFGIVIEGSCLVEGNLIGADAIGSDAPFNGSGIIVVEPGATIGGTSAAAANVISANGNGIDIEAPCLVEGNLIGTDAGGANAVENGAGIFVGGPGATIGGSTSAAANVISGNGGGIEIQASCLVEGNLIGTDKTGEAPLPNQGSGVNVDPPFDVTSSVNAVINGNTIAFNGGPGVGTLPGTTIEFNAIYGNGGPGIDLNDDGVTPNTPNGEYNTPILTSAADGIITGTLNGSPRRFYQVDFYANPASDASAARPQGRDYLTSTTIFTDAAGNGTFSIRSSAIVTATATANDGTTSEFSAPLGFVTTASGVTLSATTNVPFEGTVASFSSSDDAATAADFTATINYGEGTASSAGTVLAAPGGFIVVGSHTFTTANPFEPVTVTIADTSRLILATANSLVDVTNPGGLLTPIGHSVEFVAGTLLSRVVAGFTDSDPRAFPGQFTAMINWGDGTASSAGVVSADGAGFDVTGSHTYNFASSDSATVTIMDVLSGAAVTANWTATVDPVPITIQTINFAVTGNKKFSGTVATFTDGDPRTDPQFYTATIDWGDGSPLDTKTPQITGTNPFTVTGSHTFKKFANTDIVTITITDSNGRTATGVDRVVDPPVDPGPAPASLTTPTMPEAPVTPPAALAIVGGALALRPNKPFQGIVATFIDSGPPEAASAYKATINWGKGRKSAGMITGSNGQFVVSAKHLFSRFAGKKTVTVVVTGPDGLVASMSESVSYAARRGQHSSAARRATIE